MSRHSGPSPSRLGTSVRSQRNFLSTSPIAEQSILRDLEDAEGEENENNGDTEREDNRLERTNSRAEYSMAGSYRRISFVAFGPRPLFSAAQPAEPSRYLNDQERDAVIGEERSLLRDNQLIPPKHPRRESTASGKSGHTGSMAKRFSMSGFIPRKSMQADGEDALAEDDGPNEVTPLVGDLTQPYGGKDTPEDINRQWEAAVAAGKIQTTWQREAKVLLKYSQPLILTFFLQFTLTTVSIITVGHLGKVELGAASIGSMSANVTGYSVYIGLATSLDTLCAQAYGSGRKTLVGLQMQRMVYFLWLITIPIGALWLCGPYIIPFVIPANEREIGELAGQYLRILVLGAPGFALFESAKRFTQAQGLFQATLYVLMFCAPLNALLHWLFVWHLGWGFIGAPIAVVTIENLLPLLLFLYVRFVDGMQCWEGFTWKAFKNWGPMIRLALPGLVMVLAEFLAFEILTLTASWISDTHLAANTILATVGGLAFQLPFPVSIAASTRIANLIGATLADAGRVAAKVALVVAIFVGLFNAIMMVALRNYIPWLLTSDPEVANLASRVLPLNAAFQLFDAVAALMNGVLRGLGRQEIGSYVNIFAYYVIAIPISIATGFGLHWDLYGLWAGPAVGLGVVSAIEGWFIYKSDWQKAVDAATARNAAG